MIVVHCRHDRRSAVAGEVETRGMVREIDDWRMGDRDEGNEAETAQDDVGQVDELRACNRAGRDTIVWPEPNVGCLGRRVHYANTPCMSLEAQRPGGPLLERLGK